MRRFAKAIRKGIVAAIGIPLLIFGIILIPLPGPGLIVCFVAFFILSLEFDWAHKHLEKAKHQIKKIYDDTKARQQRILDKIDKES